ncbi:hypothetical protein C0Q70_00715 [Pomacea canaliculata]|uniref:Uncharacterized protein n=1 Tax=Pomacea canaliculata TaxID=400727 RepID=A0A2T7PXF9_POMCA|nr:hypothetical protein C0Q70_00715 [Pomacea canaliculata]
MVYLYTQWQDEDETQNQESEFSAGYQPTVGVDYGFKIQTVKNTDLRVHLWDLSGSAEYLDVRNELYCGSDAIFIVYDVTSPGSFEALESWVREANRYATGNPDIVIVGNKVDLKQKRVVSSVEAKDFALLHNYRIDFRMAPYLLLVLAKDFLPLTLADDLLLTLAAEFLLTDELAAIGVHVVRHHQDVQRDGQTQTVLGLSRVA